MKRFATVWPTIKLGSCAEFKNGLNFAAGAIGGGIKIVGVGDFGNRRTLSLDGLERVTVPDLNPSYLLKENDLLFVRSNGNKALIGRAVVLRDVVEPVTHSGFTIRARLADEHLDPDFVSYIFRTDVIRYQLHCLGAGSNISNLSQDILSELEVPRPSLEEQKSIVVVFGRADAVIDTLDARLFAARRRRFALLQQLLTGKRRFPGSRGQWQRVAIGDVLGEINRPVEMRDDVLYHLASVRRNWGGLFEREQLSGSNIKTKNLREIKTGDFLISHIQAAYGSLALVPPEFDGYKVSDLYSCLIPRDSAAFDIRFFGYLAQHARMAYLCRISSNGFFAERLRLNFIPEVFLQQVISIPPTIEEQRRIIDVLAVADREVALLEKLLAAYRQQKKGLMQQLLTGNRPVCLTVTRRVTR